MSTEADRTEARLARKQRRQDLKRRAILDAARTLLIEHGPSGLTMGALAKAADTSPSTLYYYLPGRTAVIDAVAADLVTEETDALLAAIHGLESGIDSLVAVMRRRVELFVHDPDQFAALYLHLLGTRISPQVLSERVYPQSARLMGELAARLQADQRAGRAYAGLRPREFTNVGFLAVQGILTTALAMRAAGGDLLFSVETLLEEAVRTVRRAADPAKRLP